MEEARARGATVPSLGLGTYRLRGPDCTHVVVEALAVGYRHLDTAEMYDNHGPIGEALAAAPVDRDDVFLATKVWRTNLAPTRVIAAVEDALSALGTDYVDLLLVHWPNDRVPIEDTMGAMNRLQREGRVRHVGVSNFSVEQLAAADAASETGVVTNQVRYNPYERRDDLLAYCLDHDVLLTAYSPLARGDVAEDATLEAIGEAHGKTGAQVALRWLLQQEGVVAIPKTGRRDRLRENLDVFDFELSDAEMERIFDLGGDLSPALRDALGR